MKSVISCYVLKYGLNDLLKEIGDGLVDAASAKSSITKEGTQQLIDAAVEVFHIRNRV